HPPAPTTPGGTSPSYWARWPRCPTSRPPAAWDRRTRGSAVAHPCAAGRGALQPQHQMHRGRLPHYRFGAHIGDMTSHTAPHQDRNDVDYCRISLDKSGAAEGVDSQHEENTDFSAEMGRPLTGHYEDNDISAF